MNRTPAKALLFAAAIALLFGMCTAATWADTTTFTQTEDPAQVFSALPNPSNYFGPLLNYAAAIAQTTVTIADRLFMVLVVLELFYTVTRSVLAGEDVVGMFAALCSKIISYNIAYWIFIRHGLTIAVMIASSFINTGQILMDPIYNAYVASHNADLASSAPSDPIGLIQHDDLASPPPTDPLQLLEQGADVAYPDFRQAGVAGAVSGLLGGTGLTQLAASTIESGVLGGFIVLAAYGFLAGTLSLALVEAYVVLSTGIVMTGFLGSRWTQGVGAGYFTYAISVGTKLMMVYVCIALTNPLSPVIHDLGNTPVTGPAMSAAVALVFAMVAWGAPNFAASLVQGSSRLNFANYLTSAARTAHGAAFIAPTKLFTFGERTGAAARAAGAAAGAAGDGIGRAGIRKILQPQLKTARLAIMNSAPWENTDAGVTGRAPVDIRF